VEKRTRWGPQFILQNPQVWGSLNLAWTLTDSQVALDKTEQLRLQKLSFLAKKRTSAFLLELGSAVLTHEALCCSADHWNTMLHGSAAERRNALQPPGPQ
jgi:hypothetical protein